MEKQCNSCEKKMQFEKFAKSSRNKDGYDTLCKICRNSVNRNYRYTNPSKVKVARKKHYQANIEKMRAEKMKYYENNKDAKSTYDKKYRKENSLKIREYKRTWEENRKDNLQDRIKRNLRRRLIHVVRKENKSNTTMELLGCDIDFFISFLESKFDDRMNWENYGINGWHIDHIIPCYAFDLTSESEQKRCFHYTNLQPLWWSDNLSKSKKILL
jgi:hypothetical protein